MATPEDTDAASLLDETKSDSSGTASILERTEIYSQLSWFVESAKATTESWKDTGIDRTHDRVVDARVRDRLRRDARKCWDGFYKDNATNFYKDRHYLHKVFPGIISERGDSSSKKKKTLLEIGCGVGNAFFPLMELDPKLFVVAIDLSPEAVRLIEANPAYRKDNRCRAFVLDITRERFPVDIRENLVDNVLLLFCLSAMSPDAMLDAMRHAVEPLRTGGKLFFRDYGRGDQAQLRFDDGHKLDENFYARQDGTRAYYFTLDEVRKLFSLAGLDAVELNYVKRVQRNTKKGMAWDRTWIHGIFRKR